MEEKWLRIVLESTTEIKPQIDIPLATEKEELNLLH
jgi:hypothetical protein